MNISDVSFSSISLPYIRSEIEQFLNPGGHNAFTCCAENSFSEVLHTVLPFHGVDLETDNTTPTISQPSRDVQLSI